MPRRSSRRSADRTGRQPCLARPHDPRSPARRHATAAAAADAASRSARWRAESPPRSSSARARRRLAGRPDLRPVRGRFRGHGAARPPRPPDHPGSAGRRAARASSSGSPTPTTTASARSRSGARPCSTAISTSPRSPPPPGPTTAGCGPATSGGSTPTGRLTVLDRRTDRIVRGGENISPVGGRSRAARAPGDRRTRPSSRGRIRSSVTSRSPSSSSAGGSRTRATTT